MDGVARDPTHDGPASFRLALARFEDALDAAGRGEDTALTIAYFRLWQLCICAVALRDVPTDCRAHLDILRELAGVRPLGFMRRPPLRPLTRALEAGKRIMDVLGSDR